jgi:hypothetical protein
MRRLSIPLSSALGYMYKFSDWLKHQDFVNAKFSSVFLDEINKYAVEREINPFKVIDEIRALECCSKYPSRTKKPAPFKGGLLNGLMHKHFISGNSIPINLMNHWLQNSESLNGAIETIFSQHQEGDIQLLASKIAHRLVVKGYEHKNAERSMTGDWIIYKRHNGHNYYLCTAKHGESNEEVYDRFAASAEAEFPELSIKSRRA